MLIATKTDHQSLTVKDAGDVSVEVYEQWQSVEAVLLLNAGHVDGHHLHVLLVQRLVQLVHCIQYGLVHSKEDRWSVKTLRDFGLTDFIFSF